jgi:hypothetical protein
MHGGFARAKVKCKVAAGALPLTGSELPPTYPGFSKLRRIHRLKGRPSRPFRSSETGIR